MIKVYIAGPMRGMPEFNFPAFHKAAQQLRNAGYCVFSPAEFDVLFAQEPLGVNGSSTTPPIHDFIRRDCHVIINELKPTNGDGLVMLPGWENSRGAYAERALAVWCGLRIWTLAEVVHDITDRP